MHQANCEYCGKLFVAKRPRRCCTRSCAALLTRRSLGQEWKPEEIELLENLAGSAPMPDIIKRLRNLEKRNGWNKRTPIAIQVKLKRLGLRQTCEENNFTLSELARTLKVPRDRVELWLERHGLPYRRVLRNKFSIQQSPFRKWAALHIHLLAGVDPDGLKWLTNWKNAEAIASAPLPRHGRATPIRRLDTGETYRSIKEAARQCFLHPSSSRRALDAPEYRAGGSEWETVKSQEKAGRPGF